MRGAAILLAATLLCAADRSGPYLEAGAGLGSYNDDGRRATISTETVPQYRFGAGAFINRHLSVSLQYAQFGDFEGKTGAGETSREAFKVLSADVTGHYPIFNETVDIFARFGAGELYWDQSRPERKSSSAGTLVYGIGVGIRALSWLTVNAGYDFYQFGMDENGTSYEMNLGSAYIGLQVQF
ncbi:MULTISPECIES: outer membrane beta-barrel protein [Sulfurimonas]|uniref:Outer membrane beta-barrel protein n=1 Tax=Sulfurimonas diazotrophicus TaxID=3131939 RepID=A0ABZ3HBP6_9BACT